MSQAASRGKTAENSRHPEVWLAVETSTPVGSVAVWKDGFAIEQNFRIQGSHSELLLPAIERALTTTDVQPDPLGDFVVGSGPGSFTGVRIAASIGKGWAMARGTPLYAYSSLLAVAAGCGAVGAVCALFDARRDQVYAACYEVAGGRVSERLAPGAWRILDLLEELAARDLNPAFVGEGATAYREAIEGEWKGAIVLPEHQGIPRAASLLWLRRVAPELGRVTRPHGWEPLYVRDWRVRQEGERG